MVVLKKNVSVCPLCNYEGEISEFLADDQEDSGSLKKPPQPKCPSCGEELRFKYMRIQLVLLFLAIAVAAVVSFYFPQYLTYVAFISGIIFLAIYLRRKLSGEVTKVQLAPKDK